jgi:hypothetical protein
MTDTRRRPDLWPTPTVEKPSLDDLMDQESDGVVETTDGCEVEPDGMCEHGHPSWLMRLGLI